MLHAGLREGTATTVVSRIRVFHNQHNVATIGIKSYRDKKDSVWV